MRHPCVGCGRQLLVLEALFEGPTILTGLDPTTRDQLLEMAVKRTAGVALLALQEQDEGAYQRVAWWGQRIATIWPHVSPMAT